MDIVAANIRQLRQLFPEAFTEKKVDFKVLKEILGEYVDDSTERYNFTWNGKSKARMLAQTPSIGTLRPCKKESSDWDTTQNLFIEGDNLEVLKLLQKSYHKKVKMIYIDPPYNTGKDFVYKDNFKDNVKNYKEITGQVDGDGRNYSINPETSGRYHTDWLNMMYPRLKLARNLLKDNGVIFISIDDKEISNLRKMCDEIFGEENFVCCFNWQTKKGAQGMQTNNMVVSNHEYILVYAREINAFSFLGENRTEQGFSNPDNDLRGPWKRQYLQRLGQGLPKRAIRNPENGMEWCFETPYTQENLDVWVAEKRIIFPETKDHYPARKEFLREYKTQKQLVTHLGLYATKSNTEKLHEIFDGYKIFPNPKPDELLESLTKVTSGKDDVILDFFAGSATTACVTMQLNVKDDGKRKFIMVQLPEKCDEKSEAFSAGYENIAKIGKKENRNYSGDLGFKVFKLDTTNIKPWETDSSLDGKQMEAFVENIKTGRDEQDVIYEILLKYGLDLTLPIAEHTIAGQQVFSIGAGVLIVCLSDSISSDVVKGIIKLKAQLNPEFTRVVFKDAGFEDDVAKTNAVQTLKQADVVDVKSL